ncbi:MAG TPA: amino acid adenylation domain-containing protein [Blastocatellia bacterium]|nr:amino acid adenylation domain-containing protein [Blastocatellia bacterium]
MNPKQFADFYPLSPMQQGMLFHSQLAPDSGVYIGQLICRLTGKLSPGVFERAWQRVVDRHPVLRSAFLSAELKEPVQVVHRAVTLPCEWHDWRGVAAEEQAQRIQEFVLADQRRGFKPETAPLLRLNLLRVRDDAWQMIWTYHHILFDGWSLPLILREVFACYDAFHHGREVNLPQPRPFRDYIAWLRRQDLAQAEHFWREKLRGFTVPTALGIGRLKAVSEERAYAEESVLLSAETTSALQSLARQQQLTLNTLVQGAWALLLARYSGEGDVLFGATVSGRPTDLPGAEQMIGLFINTLPVRVQVAAEAVLSEWLRGLQREQLELRQYEYSPLVQVQSWSEMPPGLPLFESILVFENAPVSSLAGQIEGATLKISGVQSNQQTNFPLTLAAMPGRELKLALGYDAERFEQAAISRLLGHLQTLLEAFIASPHARLAAVPMLTPHELRQELTEWNATAADFPADRCVHELFEAQVERSPEAVAVRFENHELTYRELNERANRLAHYLQRLGVGPETLVSICVEPSLEMVIGILGVLKAGGAYLPLDPTSPTDRLAFMLEDSGVSVLLTQQHLRSNISRLRSELRLLCLDSDWPQIASESTDNPRVAVHPENLAYLIYTSGSTGQPKGTLLEHRNLCNFAQVALGVFAITPESRVLQFASFSFDASVSEIVMALCGGARLVLARRDTLTAPDTLHELLRREKITTVTLPPSLLAVLSPDELPELRTVVSAGESCGWEIAERWAQGRRFLNGYGPTETTIGASYHLFAGRRDDADTVPIGTPVSNAKMFVLDRTGQPAPVGVPGELYIGGAGVGRGYLNRPELTAEKFINWSVATDNGQRTTNNGQRLYRTGDLVRRLSDGQLEFLGRVDTQVKIRGFRIEPGEIEAALGEHPEIQTAAVVAREDAPGDKRLVAYLVPQPESAAKVNGIREFLQEKLPAYMIPSAFVMTEALPLLPSGKINRRALLLPKYAPDGAASGREFIAPRTTEEEIIANIFAQLTGAGRVGAEDNFFELGGHSLLAAQLVSRIRSALQVELSLRDLFDAPTVAGLARTVDFIRNSAQGVPAPPIRPVPREGELPLSFAQQRLWFLWQLEPDSPFYNIPSAVRLSGQLDVDALERSLNEVIRRHESLRTTVLTRDGKAVQVIAPELTLHLPVEDLSALPDAQREAVARQRAAEEAQLTFDLERGPLIRARLLRLAEDEHVALYTLHHIISDGWSMNLLIREIAALYAAFTSGAASPLAPLEIQYADFAHWQREWLRDEVLNAQLDYWKQQLGGAPALLELPTDRPRPPVQTYRGASLPFALTAELSQQLKELSRKEGVTMFMTLLAAFQVLLARYSGQDDISVGTPIAGRNRQETESLIGLFVNTLVLRTDLSGEPNFKELLRRVRETALGAYAHQDLPFEKLVDALQPERNLSYTPLFQVMFALQNLPMTAQSLPGLKLEMMEAEAPVAKFDLSLTMIESGERLTGEFEYNTDLFDAATIERLTAHFQTLLEAIVTNPEQSVARLPMLTADESRRILSEWNQTSAQTLPEQCVHQLFAAQAARTPDATAVICGNERLSYRELDERSTKLARHLKTLGVGPDVLVGLFIERSLALPVALLGILRAGGAYLPLDPAYPADRLAFMLKDSGIAVLLTQQHLKARLANVNSEIHLVCLDADWPLIEAASAQPLPNEATPENLAYVIYTSGSTGQPKGVMIEHRSLLNHNLAMIGSYGLQASDRVLQFASISFDVAAEEIFPAWLAGATVVLRPDGMMTGSDLQQMIEREELTVINLPAPYWHEWVSELAATKAAPPASLRLVVTGSDRVSAERYAVWKRLAGSRVAWMNAYGPTEATITATLYAPDEHLRPGAEIPIGKPVANTQLYILDKHQQPVPVGVPGELCLGGAGRARGYLNRPELTAEKFIEWSVVSGNGQRTTDSGQRLYRTGDLARWLADGNVEFLGRVDEQVKIRGFRIEPGEIEAALGEHPAVREAVVIAREDTPGYKRLAAYVVPHNDAVISVDELREHLRRTLPDYMIPAVFVTLAALPLTASGKVDRRALPVPEIEQQALTADEAPRTEAEEKLLEIWQQVLGRRQFSIHDNFFAVGGDSILSIQVIARAGQAGLHLSPKHFFQNPTIAGLAAVAGTAASVHAEQGIVTGDVPLTPVQHWFFEEYRTEPQHWNMSILLMTNEPLDEALLNRAVTHLLSHHDALRLRFRRTQTGWEQFNAPPDRTVSFSYFDYSNFSAKKQRKLLEAACTATQSSLNLTEGPLIRTAYFNLGEQGRRLLIAAHHLVMDWFSLGIVLEDLATLYQQLSRGEQARLPPKTTSFRQWSTLLAEYASSPEVQQELGYWRKLAESELPPLPVDYPKGEHTNDSVEMLQLRLDAAETKALIEEVAPAYELQMNEILLAALVRACARWTGHGRLLVEMEGHGREPVVEGVDVSRTVGWFTSVFPVLLDLQGVSDPGASLTAIRAQTRAIPNRGLGYGLLRYLSPDEAVRNRLRIPERGMVNFNYLSQAVQMPGEGLPLQPAPESRGAERHAKHRHTAMLYVVGGIAEECLLLNWLYSRNQYKRATMERLTTYFAEELRRFIAECRVEKSAR